MVQFLAQHVIASAQDTGDLHFESVSIKLVARYARSTWSESIIFAPKSHNQEWCDGNNN